MSSQAVYVPAAHPAYLVYLKKKDVAFQEQALAQFEDYTKSLLEKVEQSDEATLIEWEAAFWVRVEAVIARGKAKEREPFRAIVRDTISQFEKCSVVNLDKIRASLRQTDELLIKSVGKADEQFRQFLQERIEEVGPILSIEDRTALVLGRDRERTETHNKLLYEKENVCRQLLEREQNANTALITRLNVMDLDIIEAAALGHAGVVP